MNSLGSALSANERRSIEQETSIKTLSRIGGAALILLCHGIDVPVNAARFELAVVRKAALLAEPSQKGAR
jgi:hypothetical protein